MFDKISPFDNIHPPKFSSAIATLFFIGLELCMGTMFYAVYNESIGFMGDTSLSDLPIIGKIFYLIDPDANASCIIAGLLATFSIGVPIFIWAEIFRKNILDNLREWLSHPSNQVAASFAALVLLLVISLECVSLYTLIAKETLPNPFPVNNQSSNLMSFLAKNKGMAIGISAVIALINFVLGLFSARAIKLLKTSDGDIK